MQSQNLEAKFIQTLAKSCEKEGNLCSFAKVARKIKRSKRLSSKEFLGGYGMLWTPGPYVKNEHTSRSETAIKEHNFKCMFNC